GDGYSDVLVAASGFNNPDPLEGAAFVWLGGPAGLGPNGTPVNAAWRVAGDQKEAFLGRFVAPAGDLHGDGFSDILVGGSGYDNGQTNEGRALAYLGSPSGLSTIPLWSVEGNQDYVYYASVSTAGDVNGDGYSDVIVGTALFSDVVPPSPIGFASVYLGSA